MSDGPWGVFNLPDGVHVAPCTKTGAVVKGHILRGDCPCQPKITDRDPVSDRVVLSHRDPGTPGATDKLS